VGGDLLAQVETSPGVPVPEATPQVIPEVTPDGTAPSATSPAGEEPQETPLPETTTGAGSLSKLTTSAGGRGLHIYLLVFSIGLLVLLYAGIRKMRLEGKSK
jgi:hypothetical protein